MVLDRGQSRRARLTTAALFFTAGLPFLLSLGFHAVGPRAQLAEPGPQRPALAFEQYLVDLGPVPPRPYEEARFAFTNRSDRTVTIRDLEPSCQCLNPKLEKRTYKPNESGEFTVRVVTTRQKPGPNEYYVKVAYDDPQPREVDLTFRVVLPEKQVIVRPPGKIFYQLGAEPTEEDFFVTDFRDQPLAITGVTCDSPLVTVAEPVLEVDEPGQRRYRIRVTVAGNVPAGRTQTAVLIAVDDPKYERLPLPIYIEGPRPYRSPAQTADKTP